MYIIFFLLILWCFYHLMVCPVLYMYLVFFLELLFGFVHIENLTQMNWQILTVQAYMNQTIMNIVVLIHN